MSLTPPEGSPAARSLQQTIINLGTGDSTGDPERQRATTQTRETASSGSFAVVVELATLMLQQKISLTEAQQRIQKLTDVELQLALQNTQNLTFKQLLLTEQQRRNGQSVPPVTAEQRTFHRLLQAVIKKSKNKKLTLITVSNKSRNKHRHIDYPCHSFKHHQRFH